MMLLLLRWWKLEGFCLDVRYLALAAGTALSLGAAVVGALNVTSAEGLRAAVAKGEPHIVIVSHLDLRIEASDMLRNISTDSVTTNSTYQLGALEPTEFTRTIRGDCLGPVPWELPLIPVKPLRPGQCMLLTSGPFLMEAPWMRPFSLWLDNLYFRLQRDSLHVDVAPDTYMFLLNKSATRVWLTRSTVQGDAVLEGSALAIGSVNASMFVNDVLVADFKTMFSSGGAIIQNSTFSVNNTVFSRILANQLFSYSYVLVLGGDSSAAMLVGNNVSFVNNDVTGNFARVNATSVIYGNSSVTAAAGYQDYNELPLEPADKAPVGTFLEMDGSTIFAQIARGAPTISADLGPPSGADSGTATEDLPGRGAPSGTIVGSVVGAVILIVMAVAATLVFLITRRKWRMRRFLQKLEATQPPMSNQPSSLPPMAGPRSTEAVGGSSGGSGGAQFGGTGGTGGAESGGREAVKKLEAALDTLHADRVPFVGRYLMRSAAERQAGSHGIVQFVTSAHDPSTEYAIRFYTNMNAFARERELFMEPVLREMVPATHEVIGNEGGILKMPGGYVFPPSIVVEKGENLEAWTSQDCDLVTIVQALMHVGELLKTMHDAGWVHRNLKPSNVIRLRRIHAWSLIDFGCTAPAGKEASLNFSLAYAAPEVVAAYEARRRTVVVDPSADIWSFGLIAYETLTGTRVFEPGTPDTVVADAIVGRTKLPWEAEEEGGMPSKLSKRALRGFHPSVMQCLSRNSTKRPSIDVLLSSWRHLFMS